MLNHLGRALQKLTDYEQAIVNFLAASKIAEKIGNRLLEGVALTNIGETYALSGDADNALFYYEKALPIFSELDESRASSVAERIASLTMKR